MSDFACDVTRFFLEFPASSSFVVFSVINETPWQFFHYELWPDAELAGDNNFIFWRNAYNGCKLLVFWSKCIEGCFFAVGHDE